MRPTRVALILTMSGIGVATVWMIMRGVEERRCQTLLEHAKTEMSVGRYGKARDRLKELLERRPEWDEAWYNLGVCEQTRDRTELALAALAKVSPGSDWAGWSAVRRSRLEMDRGRFAEAEKLLVRAAGIPGTHVAEARWGMVLLLRQQGRFDEARRWLEVGFDLMSSSVETLQRLYKLDVDPFPIEGIRVLLDRAGRQAQDDDRVWLARAHMAIRVGNFREARSWLDRCLKRRPDDPAVWRMKLDWAMAAGLPAEAMSTLVHLPADREPEGLVPALRAWFAARRGDTETERRALRQAVDLNPADASAIERLAALEREAGRPEEAVRLRRSLPDIDRCHKEYVRLLSSDSPELHADELARVAERLGRRFDAARWSAMAGIVRSDSRQKPERDQGTHADTGGAPSRDSRAVQGQFANADHVPDRSQVHRGLSNRRPQVCAGERRRVRTAHPSGDRQRRHRLARLRQRRLARCLPRSGRTISPGSEIVGVRIGRPVVPQQGRRQL